VTAEPPPPPKKGASKSPSWHVRDPYSTPQPLPSHDVLLRAKPPRNQRRCIFGSPLRPTKRRARKDMARRRRPPRPGALTELPPLKILAQIFILQTVFYVTGTALVLFAAVIQGSQFGADLVLDWNSLRGDTTRGWTLGLVWMCNSFVGYVASFCPLLFHNYAVGQLQLELNLECIAFCSGTELTTKQRSSPHSPHLPVKTYPRLRPYPPFPPPHHRVPLLALHSPKPPLVDPPTL
jgi:hypothetical protein